ncbi:twin-arginine translocation pathway signal protein [Roseomonas eburnea]|uniref:Twin-arginine translocation pathway signal protein n=1 Tax=Neoroseomonas eburnea TaxID=1346889 RepID=A0A9X9X9Q2_9PROT|nr:tripartite tricarboxylate transporter substrate-binding protein [Neoroseomonas eburnea]MBR0680438.1 twin-arginine translocation pathway signal protein [Neoroseomonas eburnea]
MPFDRRALLGAALVPAFPRIARAQAFPAQPIRIIPPYPPGGGTDTVARLLQPHLAAQLGQSVVIENRGGAGGSIGAAEVARAPKDGHTLLLDSMGHVVNPTLMQGLSFDYASAFAPITQLTWQPQMLVVPVASPFRSIADLVAAAKARPGTLSYASSGNGTGAHLAMVEFSRMAGIEVMHVPYRGGGPAMTDLVAGNVAMAFASASAATAHVQGGRLRGLGAAGLRRIGALPDMPTIADQGFPGFDFDEWNGLWTVAGSPPAAITRLHAAAVFALAQPDVRARMAQIGIVPVGNGPDEFAAFVVAQRERAARLIRDANITLG